MNTTSAEIAQYRNLLATRLRDAFRYKGDLLPINPTELLEQSKHILDNISGFIVICNYTKGTYEYISNGIKANLGYDITNFSEAELTNLIFSAIHDKHRAFMIDILLPVVLDYFKGVDKPAVATDTRYTVCLKMKNIYGEYFWFLVDTTVIEADDKGSPVRTLITCTNIDHFKKDDIIYYNILKKNEQGIYEVVLEGSEDHRKLETPLTLRELEVINLVSLGLTNKEIADKLFVTLNTIKTHRKNVMKKTNCKGTADLTNFAFARGLL